jgi:arsenate reductase
MKKGVLFICQGNACRSIIAEALAKHHFDGLLRIGSAGVSALGSIPLNTLEVLKEVNVSCEGLYSKDIDEIDTRGFDIIVNLTDFPIDRFIPNGFRGKVVDSYVRDPYGRNLDSYRQTRNAIEQILLDKLPKWLGGPLQ